MMEKNEIRPRCVQVFMNVVLKIYDFKAVLFIATMISLLSAYFDFEILK